MMATISASTLYDLTQCPKRVAMDMFGDANERDEANAFVEMLWRRGSLYEQEVVSGCGLKVLDLSKLDSSEKERETRAALQRGEPLIYGGRISEDDLVGVPDLLRREGDRYRPIDIKSGSAEEIGGNDEDGKPKLHYAVQLALYVDLLERTGFSAGRQGYIYDGQGREMLYDLESRRTTKSGTLWEEYEGLLGIARSIADQSSYPRAALASVCKVCHWQSSCVKQLQADDDLTLIPMLGRSLRDAMVQLLPTVAQLAACDLDSLLINGKSPFKGVGESRLRTFQERARLLKQPGAKAYLKAPLNLPMSRVDYFLDIEVDPLRDFTYLHGVVERHDGDTVNERFFAFFSDNETPASERRAFAAAVAHLSREPDAMIWYFSKYERTMYRKLQERYPDVCSEDEIEHLFDPSRAVDLYYDVVAKMTEWPTNDHSIKTLAKYLGFSWRDTNPSGAASIEWFDQWVRTRNPEVRSRIIAYNEDDCRATRVLLDGIRALTLKADAATVS